MLSDNTAQNNTDGGGEVAAPTPANPEFHGSLPEDLRTNEALYGFEDLGGLAKSFVETSGKLTEQEQAIADLQGKVPVIPASAGEYNVEAPEGYNTEGIEGFLEMAHEKGMSAEQANALLEFDHKRNTEFVQKSLEAEANAIGALKTEWGDSYDANAKMAADAVSRFGGDELKQFLNESRLGNNPVLVKMFHKIATAISEDALLTGNANHNPNERQMGIGGKPILKFKDMK